MVEKQNVELKLIHMEDVVSKEVEWLWYPYIPYGKITIIEGDPGEGKTTLVLKLAAALSRGLPLPCDDDKEYEPIHIIYQTAEDGIEDTIKPRLEKAGADCSMIRVIDETDKELSMTDDRLEQAIIETKARLIILDPIQAYIGATVDMHRANEIRPVLKHLGIIAEKHNCAIILISHMNKASSSKSTYRGLGSIDIQATARSVLLVARLRDKPNIRIMAHDKSSLAPAGDAIGFEMTEDNGMVCIGPYDITIDELLSGNEGRGKKKLDIAENFIKEYFGSNKVSNHYQIKRTDGTLAESTLSEGEVTFITFLYFLQWIKGSQNEEEVTQDRIIVIDDPISSLDSNVLFVVSSLLKDVIYKVLDGESNIKQVFVLTHNVYFHKELSFIGNGNNPNKEIHYWILRKKNDITNIQYYGMDNPISSSYELLWKEVKEQNANSVITIQNVMRRIIENYFKILGKYKDDELINKFPDYESQEICRSLLSWINDGSHCMPDDLYVEALDDSSERYREVFKKIFEYTNHIEHYNMMMGINEKVE